MSSIYQIKIQLHESSEPSVWRQIQVPSTMNLHLLHCCIQGAMGWFNTHLHQFSVGNTLYGIPHPVINNGLKDERKAFLKDILKDEGAEIAYEYDFCNSWRHIVLLEKIITSDSVLKQPVLLRGVGACPPEDCDGIKGFQHLKWVMQNPKHPEFEDVSEFLEAETFDAKAFDLAEHRDTMQYFYSVGLADN